MVMVVFAKEVDVALVGRESIIFELLKVDELSLVDAEVVETKLTTCPCGLVR